MPKWSREYLLTFVLAGLALLLGLAAIAEWALLEKASRKILSIPSVKAASVETPDATTEPDFELPALEEYQNIVERPLFAENRRPVESDGTVTSTPVPSSPLTLKLMGVVFTPKQHTALLVDAKGKYKRVRKNEALDGWTLVNLEPGKVTMQQGEEQKELMLLKPKPKALNAPNAPPQPGRQPPPRAQIQQNVELEQESEAEEVTDEEVQDDEEAQDEEMEEPEE